MKSILAGIIASISVVLFGNCAAAQGDPNIIDVVKAYGANNTCTGDATAAIQAAINTGKTIYIPTGCYLISSDLTLSTSVQHIFGDSPGRYSQSTGTHYGTVILVNSNSNFSHGVFYFNSGEEGPMIQNLGITFAQPNTSGRSALTNYVPAIYAQNTPRFRLYNLRITECNVCIDMRGNSGGAFLDQLELSGFGYTTGAQGTNALVMIDGSVDIVRISHTHIWPFDLTPAQMALFDQPTTVGMSVGRMDGLMMSDDFFEIGTGMNLFYGTGSNPGPASINATNLLFDSFGGITAAGNGSGRTGPQFSCSSCSFSLENGFYESIVASAGNFNFSSTTFIQSSTGAPIIYVNDSTGILDFNLNNSTAFMNFGANTTLFQQAGGANASSELNSIHVVRDPGYNYTQPTFYKAASGSINNWSQLTTPPIGSGHSGTFINVISDNYDYIVGNISPGWTITVPTAVNGVFSPNPH